jgi:hypothetical protein
LYGIVSKNTVFVVRGKPDTTLVLRHCLLAQTGRNVCWQQA